MSRNRNASVLALTTALAFVAVALPGAATQRALLVGVGDYPGREMDLKGPPHDVTALRRELVGRLGFPPQGVEVLLDADATSANIIGALRRIATDSAANDFVLVYLSGHGTSAYDPRVPVALAHNTGAFVPVDYRVEDPPKRKLDKLIVGSRDLRPLLAAIDETGAYGLVMIDSCYSRNTSRSLYAAAPPVYRQIDTGIEHIGAFSITSGNTKDAGDYPYERILTMAASGAKEVAIDVNEPTRTLDGKPHGAFTDAVLRALREFPRLDANGDTVVTNGEFFASVKRRMAEADIPHSPQLLPSPGTDRRNLAGSAVFGTAATLPAAPAPLPAVRLRVRVDATLPIVADAIDGSDELELATAAADLVVKRGNGAFHLLTRYGDAVASVATEEAAADALRQQPWIRHLVRRLGQRAADFDVALALRGETFEEGEELAISATPKASAYLLVVDIAPNGALRVLYPPRRTAFAATGAGRPVSFRAKVNPPFGIDHVVAAAFAQPPTFYDSRLLADAEIAVNTPLHGEIVEALVGQAGAAVGLAKVVTVPANGAGKDA